MSLRDSSWAWALSPLLLGACHSVVVLDAPSLGSARAALVVVAPPDGEALGAYAVDLAADAVWPDLSVQPPSTVLTLAYTCDVARLGLAPGWQALQDPAAQQDLLPPPAVVLATEVEEASSSAWALQAQLPDSVVRRLRRLPLTPAARCRAAGARFESRVLAVPNDGHGPPAFLVPVDERRTLAGTRDGKLYQVDLDGTITRLVSRERWPDPYVGAHRTSDGILWLVTAEGQVARGTLEQGFETVTSTTAFPQQQRIAVTGSTGGAPFELFAEGVADDRRLFARFDGVRWQPLASVEWDGIFLPAVVWVGPGEAVAIGAGESGPNTVSRYKNGEAREEILRGASGLSAILQHSQLGTVVGRDTEGLFRFVGRTWEPLEGLSPVTYIRVFSAEGPGFLYGGSVEFNFSATAFSQYHPTIGFCATTETYTDVATSHLARLGEHALVAATLAGFSSPMGLTLLERTQEAASCSDPASIAP
ncbi:MAG: hypothetical protein IT384_08910 [Deltaproteobacteria bacterium]|nr:hypothetical protein [Deltaproteobacteria bacterium]